MIRSQCNCVLAEEDLRISIAQPGRAGKTDSCCDTAQPGTQRDHPSDAGHRRLRWLPVFNRDGYRLAMVHLRQVIHHRLASDGCY